MTSIWSDMRYALRMLAKNPGFTAIAVLTLALGIGANTAIFSFTDQILLRDLPVPNPQQLVVLRSPGPDNGHCWSDIDKCAQSFSYPMYKALRGQAAVFSGLLAYHGANINVSGHGVTQSAHGVLVSGNYFQTLEVQPALGRLFTASDEGVSGENTVAVLSYSYWARQFGADPSILNKPLVVNGVPLTVVGVARKGFDGVQVGETPDVFVPVTMKSQMMPTEGQPLEDRGDFWLPLVARLAPGITPVRAQASLQPVYAALLKEDAEVRGGFSPDLLKRYISKPLFLVDGAHGRMVLQQDTEEPLLVLMSMVALVLLIACTNLAGLLVARGEARQREVALRLALGAGRARLIRQLLTESLLIGLAGGAAGIALASWCLNALVGAIPQDQGMLGLASGVDLRVLWFAIALTLATSILFGLAPALRATRVDLQSTLKEQGSSVSEGRSNAGLRKILIVAQVALTAVLLAGAGLFARTLANLEHANLGVNTSHVLQFSVAPDLNGHTPAQTLQFADSARREIAALPAVRSVSISTIPIFADDDMGFNITPQGYAMRHDEDTNVLGTYVGPDYFSTMGIPLIAGREFTVADGAATPKVCIINEKLAQRFFAGRTPIGLHIARGAGTNVHPDIEIVGVVANSKWDGPRSEVVPFMYMPYSQNQRLGLLSFYVRTDSAPESMAGTLRSVVSRLDPDLPVNNMRALNAQISDSMFDARLVAMLSVSLALLAALMAALGLYGVLAYVVARRTREIGIRMALGGQRGDILRLVIGQGAWLSLIGGTIGIIAALIASQWVASLLYGVTARDPLTFIGVVVLLGLVSGAACYIPARRAVRVDPLTALRYE
ncbi:MAG TPA: ABC transporter permease [Candidatus Acidoferrales bacterium]|nr:ABC transporter permease [Candidatus Acidoferrales bacterium]